MNRPAAEEAATTTATSDAKGRFEIDAPRGDDVGLWIERAGYFPLKISPADLPRETETPIEAVLAPLGRIELALVDENGSAVAGAPITYMLDVGRGSQDLRWAHRRFVPAGSTGADGRITIADLPCGMPISLRGARTSDDDWLGVVTIDLHARVLDHEARLPSKPKVRGRIVRAGATPEAGSTVTWRPFPLDYRASVQAQSGGDGRFELAQLRPGKAEIRFGPAGTPPRVVTLAAGETKELGDLEIPDVVALGGRLVSRLGPLEGAFFVTAFRDGRTLLEMPVRDGTFEGSVTAGALELIVTRGRTWSDRGTDPHNDALARVALIDPAPNVEIAIDEARGAVDFTLAGVDAEIGWGVYPVESPSPWAVASGVASRGKDGRVRVGPIVPGRYRVRLSVQNVGAAFSSELAVVAGRITEGGELALGRAALIARVVDGSGRPVPRADVRAYGSRGDVQATTGDDGRARLEGFEPGFVQVRVAHGDLGRLTREGVEVAAGETREHVFELRGFAAIEGTLTAGGRPVASTSVNLQPDGSNDQYNASTGALGRFRLEKLPPGRLRLWVHGHVMTSVDVEPGETRRLDLELGAAHEVRFVRDGAVLDGLFSVAAIGADPTALAARCWAMGEVEDTTAIVELPRGRVLFNLSCGATGSQQSFVAIGSDADESVTMPRGSVTIETSGPWNGPLPRARLIELDGVAVVGMWGGAIELALDVDADGRARVPCLPPNARVEVRGHDSRGAPFVVEATTGADGRGSVRWP